MSEETESKEFETENIKELSHRRILFLMGLVSVLGSICGFVFVSWQFGLGILFGGTLSFVNYYWLKHSLKIVFEKVASGEQQGFSGTTYLLRYFVFGILLLLIYLTKAIPVASVILGLGSFAVAIMFEGIIRLFTSFNK